MKAELGISPDTRLNNEILTMKKNDFLMVLKAILQEDETLKQKFEIMEKEIQNINVGEELKKVFSFLLTSSIQVLGITQPLPVESLQKLFLHCRSTINSRRGEVKRGTSEKR